MRYDFDREISRQGSNSVKWEFMPGEGSGPRWVHTDRCFGENRLLPMWVADMDFPAPQPVVEALVARALGLRVVGLGWVSNMASGLVPKQKLSHHDVLSEAQKVEPSFTRLIKAFLESI